MSIDATTIIVVVAVLAVLVLAFLVMRPRRQRLEQRREEPKGYVASKERPYVKPPRGGFTQPFATLIVLPWSVHRRDPCSTEGP